MVCIWFQNLTPDRTMPRSFTVYSSFFLTEISVVVTYKICVNVQFGSKWWSSVRSLIPLALRYFPLWFFSNIKFGSLEDLLCDLEIVMAEKALQRVKNFFSVCSFAL